MLAKNVSLGNMEGIEVAKSFITLYVFCVNPNKHLAKIQSLFFFAVL